ncbi:Oidioi.mRNA.OKI2018_I69.PAR.g11484.t1.cds [Oikopleura dioica]|uniref:Oidioi.mRNA.OKI2018_I69.PAR.g11484.t1.cds n=1 Tax=Oikopleura dioica TaxID=34765 RepID=A0ABN7RVT3_OIKDI|nr:Oidioi.mRNA.OKI2018_I69.PAR.g11484.t1.cds [Oikopleura dioica]
MKIIWASLAGLGVAKTKTECEACKRLQEGIERNLKKTKNQNFGGGNSKWEESRLGPWATSESRMIQTIEYACEGDFRCSSFLEEYEEDVEDWFKTGPDSAPEEDRIDFFKEFCVEKSKSCCEDKNSFGKDCQACPTNVNQEVCSGRGTCEGAGDRKGKGGCKCNHGYSGKHCDECSSEYFLEKEVSMTEKPLCTKCLHKCKQCKGEKGKCLGCRDGYEVEGEIAEDGTHDCKKPKPKIPEPEEDDQGLLDSKSVEEVRDPPEPPANSEEVDSPPEPSTTAESSTTRAPPTPDPRFGVDAFAKNKHEDL